jgi:hypothetical protein
VSRLLDFLTRVKPVPAVARVIPDDRRRKGAWLKKGGGRTALGVKYERGSSETTPPPADVPADKVTATEEVLRVVAALDKASSSERTGRGGEGSGLKDRSSSREEPREDLQPKAVPTPKEVPKEASREAPREAPKEVSKEGMKRSESAKKLRSEKKDPTSADEGGADDGHKKDFLKRRSSAVQPAKLDWSNVTLSDFHFYF